MAQNIDLLIQTLRNSTARDSVSPADIAALLQAIRDETDEKVYGDALEALTADEIDYLLPPATDNTAEQ